MLAMRGLPVRPRSWTKRLALPIFLLGFLIVHFGLLAAHGLPAHAAAMAPATVSGQEDDSVQRGHEALGQDRADDVGKVGSVQAHSDHPHDGDSPFCHADPSYTWEAAARPLDDELTSPAFRPSPTPVAIGLSLSPWLQSRLWRWSTRPHWRPAGANLLTVTCIARI